jgi:hypothetical protein
MGGLEPPIQFSRHALLDDRVKPGHGEEVTAKSIGPSSFSCNSHMVR